MDIITTFVWILLFGYVLFSLGAGAIWCSVTNKGHTYNLVVTLLMWIALSVATPLLIGMGLAELMLKHADI